MGVINSKKFGLIHSVDPAMRISTRYGARLQTISTSY